MNRSPRVALRPILRAREERYAGADNDMTRRPRTPTYRAAMDAIRHAYLTLLRALEHRMEPDVRTLLAVVIRNLETLVQRDDGRSR